MKTSRAWPIRESLRHLWQYVQRESALWRWKCQYFWTTLLRLQPVIKAALTLKRQEAGLFCCFAHCITRLEERTQLAGTSNQNFRSRIPQPRVLQNRHPFSLWQIGNSTSNTKNTRTRTADRDTSVPSDSSGNPSCPTCGALQVRAGLFVPESMPACPISDEVNRSSRVNLNHRDIPCFIEKPGGLMRLVGVLDRALLRVYGLIGIDS